MYCRYTTAQHYVYYIYYARNLRTRSLISYIRCAISILYNMYVFIDRENKQISNIASLVYHYIYVRYTDSILQYIYIYSYIPGTNIISYIHNTLYNFINSLLLITKFFNEIQYTSRLSFIDL